MRLTKKIVVFSIVMILMLSLSAVVRASPPRNRSIASDHLDLNALDKASLSNSLASQEDPDEEISEDGDEDEDDADREDDTDNDDNGDTDGDDDGDTGDDDENETEKEHPVAAAMADYFGVEHDQIKELHEAGSGFGNLAKTFFLAETLEGDLLTNANAILQNGWGQAKKGSAGRVGSLGFIMRNAKKAAPKPDDSGDSIGASSLNRGSTDASGNGKGNGHPKEKNNGKSKGKAKGKGKK